MIFNVLSAAYIIACCEVVARVDMGYAATRLLANTEVVGAPPP